ncbi:hypothetical protein C0993_012194 [Termitomyces sp. T159_Od127]|nr:hypothetical protein C0993_012194 [Termitomyces sp. T159_Od127]
MGQENVGDTEDPTDWSGDEEVQGFQDGENEKEAIDDDGSDYEEGARKKGAELEEAVEEWDKSGRRLSTAARCNVDPDKGKVCGAINQLHAHAPCDTAANCTLKTKPLPSIITTTIKPSPPSSPLPCRH